MRSAQLTTSPSGVDGAGRDHEWFRMPSSVSRQRFRLTSDTSAPQTAWSNPPTTKGSSASSLAWPPGPWPQSCPSAMASVRATLSPSARATPVATWATSSAWVSRVRMWSSGKTKTWVLPASRRKALECRTRSRSRSKQVRNSSGSSWRARFPAPYPRVAPMARRASNCSSRSAREPGRRDETSMAAEESRWATVTSSAAPS